VQTWVIDVERAGGLDGGSTLNQQETQQYLISVKKSYKFGDFSGETNVQYSRFRWIMQKHSTRIVRK
jgi:hypothetical protein